MSLGQELLDVPIADLVRDLAAAVAEGQLALDRASIETLRFLADPANAIDLVPAITEVITATSTPVKVGDGQVNVPGVAVQQQPVQTVKTPLLQAGLLPTFYQFSEALIEVKLSISIQQASEAETEGKRPGFYAGRRALVRASPVNFRSASTYSYNATGSSLLRVVMKPVPPPPRLLPDLVSVNATVNPPVVNRQPR